MYAFAFRFVRPYWRWLIIVIFAILIETSMSLASPWPLKIVLDSVLGHRPVPWWLQWLVVPESGQYAVLLGAVIATVAIAMLQAAGKYLNMYYTSNIGQWVAHDLRQTAYAHLHRLSMSFYDRQQVGPLISTLTEDIDAVQDFISISALMIFVNLITVIGMLTVMLTLHLRFTLVALLLTPLVGLFVYRLRHIVKQATRVVRRRQGEILSIAQEGLGAIKLVKAFAQGKFERERFDEKSIQSVKAALYARRARALVGPVVTIFAACATATVLWFGAREVIGGVMTVGLLVVFMTYLGRLFQPIQDLARISTNIAQAAVGLERVMTILQADERLPRAPHPRVLAEVRGAVEFCGVTFGYDPARPVLHDISLRVEPGQHVALVGQSGSGKSTLASLIPRFYDPVSGAVTIDGVDIREVTFRSLRGNIGFVLQDTILFHATVWQNIRYGRMDATRDEIEAAARLAHAHEFIVGLPDGYDTVVGPGSFSLSGGQRQRLGIARAIVRNAPILILDEPSSGLDLESERLVMDGLHGLLAGKTTFIIAHRMSTIRNVDRIIVLDHGRIVAHGTHDELRATCHTYTKLLSESSA